MSKPVKILVVDDEHDVEILFKQQFRREIRSGDLEMVFAFSGAEALRLLENSDPPEIMYMFSDINMPGMTGLELLDSVKQRYPNINVSMISAYGDDENYQNAIQSGAKEFFTKPINFEQLRNEIRTYLESKS